MKKLSIFLCCVLLLQLLCACSKKDEEILVPVNFYYSNKEFSYNTSSAVIHSELREGYGFEGNVASLIETYLRGPETSQLKSLIPLDVVLVSCEQRDEHLELTFSSEFSELSGVKLTAACSALLMTLHEFADIQTVAVCALDCQLDDKNVFELSIDDIVTLDSAMNI